MREIVPKRWKSFITFNFHDLLSVSYQHFPHSLNFRKMYILILYLNPFKFTVWLILALSLNSISSERRKIFLTRSTGGGRARGQKPQNFQKSQNFAEFLSKFHSHTLFRPSRVLTFEIPYLNKTSRVSSALISVNVLIFV